MLFTERLVHTARARRITGAREVTTSGNDGVEVDVDENDAFARARWIDRTVGVVQTLAHA
jgi:hypothetical protein